MSDIHLHHDLYHEASARRASEADRWVRDQKTRRSARRAASRRAHTGIRVHLLEALARVMGVAEELRASSVRSQPQRTAHKHTH